MEEPQNLEKCDYMWPDFDFCEKVKGHDGEHGITPPYCGAVMPGLDLMCDISMWHTGPHQVTLRWSRKSDERINNG